MKRRDFIKKSMMTMGVLGMAKPVSQKKNTSSNAPKLPVRPYGDKGVNLSIIGFGGIVVKDRDPQFAARAVAQAVEKGCNYFDVAPTYGDAEEKLGPALEPYRKDCFLACKTTRRNKKGAQKELEESLKKLRTDHLDLYQLHAITDVEKDVHRAFAKGGCMEVFLEAKKQGIVKYLGFSAHSEEAALAAMNEYDFDSILFPVNFCTWYKGGFGQKVVEAAAEKGVAILALKSTARQKWPENHPERDNYPNTWYEPLTDRRKMELAMKFTLSKPTTAIVPPGVPELFFSAVDIAMNIESLTMEEEQQLAAMAQELDPIFTATA